MESTRHCELCQNVRSDYKTGLYCGLTNRKPDFNRTCAKISFGSKLNEKLTETYVDKKKYHSAFLKSLLIKSIWIMGGILSMFFCAQIVEAIPFRGVYSTAYEKLGIFIVYAVFFMGLITCSFSAYLLSKDWINLKYASKKISGIDEVLSLYNKRYEVKVSTTDEFGTGFKETRAEVYLKN